MQINLLFFLLPEKRLSLITSPHMILSDTYVLRSGIERAPRNHLHVANAVLERTELFWSVTCRLQIVH